MTEDYDYIVTYHFTSGDTLQVQYSYEIWKEYTEHLYAKWSECLTADLTVGINFAQVTHYTAEKVEK